MSSTKWTLKCRRLKAAELACRLQHDVNVDNSLSQLILNRSMFPDLFLLGCFLSIPALGVICDVQGVVLRRVRLVVPSCGNKRVLRTNL